MRQGLLDPEAHPITQSSRRMLELSGGVTRASCAQCRSESVATVRCRLRALLCIMMRPVWLVVGGAFSVLLITAPCDSRPPSKETKPHQAHVGSQEALRAPDTSSGQADNAEGIEHYEQGHWDQAAHHFRRATMADPELAEAYFNLALAMGQLGKPHDAKAAFKKAVELAPDDPRMKEASMLKPSISK
jgi:tetratricopeptide (TPR) repeat protein